jgi:hypothetical protein
LKICRISDWYHDHLAMSDIIHHQWSATASYSARQQPLAETRYHLTSHLFRRYGRMIDTIDAVGRLGPSCLHVFVIEVCLFVSEVCPHLDVRCNPKPDQLSGGRGDWRAYKKLVQTRCDTPFSQHLSLNPSNTETILHALKSFYTCSRWLLSRFVTFCRL